MAITQPWIEIHGGYAVPQCWRNAGLVGITPHDVRAVGRAWGALVPRVAGPLWLGRAEWRGAGGYGGR